MYLVEDQELRLVLIMQCSYHDYGSHDCIISTPFYESGCILQACGCAKHKVSEV